MSIGDKPLPEDARPDTIAVRAGQVRSPFEETSEALYLTSGYTFASPDAAEAAFAGEVDRHVYSRYGNPTVEMFEKRLAALEGAESCQATASGMSAVFVALGAVCPAGARLVASRALFGSCHVICAEILPRWGVEVEFVDGSDLDQWREALSRPAAAVFCETPSNPLQEIVDIAAVSELAHAAGATVVVDNVFATPVGQHPLELGADVVVYSGTKHIDGQGRVLGGAILGSEEFINGDLRQLIRHTGPSLSPFNAWVLLKGLETLRLRVDHMCSAAAAVADALAEHEAVRWVRYPFHPSHPQVELARRQMTLGGSVVTFGLEDKEAAFVVARNVQVIDVSNNLGDAKSLMTHPATTTHRAMGPEGRAAMGLDDGTLRISVGLEDPQDLIADLRRGLDHLLDGSDR